MKRYIRSAINVGPIPPTLHITNFRENKKDYTSTQSSIRRLVEWLDCLTDASEFKNPVVSIEQHEHQVTAKFKNKKSVILDADNLDPNWATIVSDLVENG